MFNENCENMGDYLKIYNLQDVLLLFPCIQRHFDFFKRLNVSMWHDAQSIPGVSMKVAQSLAKTMNNKEAIYLFGDEFSHLQDDLRNNIAGGLALTMHRMLVSGESRFNDCKETGERGQICASLFGFDASSQYLGCTADFMPCGPLHFYKIIRDNDDVIQSVEMKLMNANAKIHENQSNVAFEYLRYLESKYEAGTFLHARSPTGEKLCGPLDIPVDGYHKPTQTAYQFAGCFHHGCECSEPQDEMSYAHVQWTQKRERTEKMNRYHQLFSDRLVIMKECEWQRLKRTSQEVKDFMKNEFESEYLPKMHLNDISDEDLCEDVSKRILSDRLFGLVCLDIETPTELKEYFAIFQPVIKNVELQFSHLSPTMQAIAKENGIMDENGKGRRNLIGSYFGKRMILITPLLKWYLQKGLKITKIYYIMQYRAHKVYEGFKDVVIQARQEASLDPSRAVLAKTYKLLVLLLYYNSLFYLRIIYIL